MVQGSNSDVRRYRSMRLGEMGNNLPRVAGKAKLEYSINGTRPYREGDTIIIPDKPLGELFSLRDDCYQFLYSTNHNNNLWFGGTDENPFLVEMNPGLLGTFLGEGTRAFYLALVPGGLTTLASRLPNHQCRIGRQGDIFFLSVSYSYYTIAHAHKLITGKDIEVKSAKDHQIFGTRHILNGDGFQDFNLLGTNISLMVTGVIEAPDHSPVALKRLSILGQTQGLVDPHNAD